MQYVDVSPLVLITASFVGLALVVILVGLWRGSGRAAVRCALLLLLVGSAAVVLTATLGPVTPGAGDTAGAAVNLVPFRDIAAIVGSGNEELAMLNVIGNVLLFVPVGLLLELLVDRPALSLGVTVLLSVFVELLQYATGRSADIDDVILNGVGAGMGVALAVLVRVRIGNVVQ